MMKDQICLVVCEILKNEIEAVVRAGNFESVKIVSYPSQCALARPNSGVIRNAMRRCGTSRNRTLLIGGCMLSWDLNAEDREGINLLHTDQCLELLINRETLESYAAQGAYLLTPGWLRQWRHHLQVWGFDRNVARSFFSEIISRLVLLDTGTDAGSAKHLQEFGEFVNLPFEKIPIGLDYLELQIAKFYLEWALNRERRRSRESLEEALKQSSDYAMAFDLIGSLTGMMSEKQVIEKIFELFTTLFAPQVMVYLPKLNNRYKKALSYPANLELSAELHRQLISQKQDYIWTDADDGFSLKLCHDENTLGILKVDGIAFPQFKGRYLNISLAIKKVCALAIANARTYQKLEKAVTDLQRALVKREIAERALKISERKLNSIITTIPDIVYRLNPYGTIDFISDSVKKYGYSPASLLGIHISQLVHPDDRQIASHRINERRTGDRSTGNLEVRILPEIDRRLSAEDPNRSRVNPPVFLISAEGLYTSENPSANTFLGTQGIARDITNQKQIEVEKKELENRMHRAQKMESIGTLAGGIAHDFNNLLMGIQGHVSLMSFDMKSDHPFYKSISSIEAFIESAANLTKQLLGFARGGKYEVKVTDLNKLIRSTSQMFGRTRKEIQIRLNLLPDLWTVAVDQGQIEQVLFNLYLNAWQAMPGGGTLSIETANRTVSHRSAALLGAKTGEYAMITVSDTGIGMDQETLDRIYEPFFTTREMGRGTGLGLSSVYGIIQNHDGLIDVQSRVDRGSTFSICLPVAKSETVVEEKDASNVLTGSETVMLIEDEPLIAEIGRQYLTKLGYVVLTAANGREAIEIYQKKGNEIDLIILDLIMPGMGGEETFKRLKELNPDVKVLLASGFSDESGTHGILQRSCNGFIQKPYKLIDFSRKLRTVLDCKLS